MHTCVYIAGKSPYVWRIIMHETLLRPSIQDTDLYIKFYKSTFMYLTNAISI